MSKGIFIAIALCALVSAAQAREMPDRDFDCQPPKKGKWSVEHYIPVAPGINKLTLQGRSNLTLREAFPGAYKGEAVGELINSILAPDTGGDNTWDLVASFDPEHCLLTGTIFNFDIGFNDPFRWTVGKNRMSGPYVNSANSTILFTTFARHDVQYEGPL